MSEADVLRAVQDYLAVNDIWFMRCNTGAFRVDKRFVRFGSPGMADILAAPNLMCDDGDHRPHFLWLECKTEKGKQSELQKAFEDEVLERGHRYFVVRSIEDLQMALDSL